MTEYMPLSENESFHINCLPKTQREILSFLQLTKYLLSCIKLISKWPKKESTNTLLRVAHNACWPVVFLLTVSKKDGIRKWTDRMRNPPPTVPHRLLTTRVTYLTMSGCLCKFCAYHGEFLVAARLCGLTALLIALLQSPTPAATRPTGRQAGEDLYCVTRLSKHCVKLQFKTLLKYFLPLEDEEHLRQWVNSHWSPGEENTKWQLTNVTNIGSTKWKAWCFP